MLAIELHDCSSPVLTSVHRSLWHGSGTKSGLMPAYPGGVSESRNPAPKPPAAALGLEELATLAGAGPLADASELLADIWDSDEELDAFLGDVQQSRNTSVA